MPGVIVAIVMGALLGWVASEYQERRWLRIGLGLVAIGMSYAIAAGVGSMERWNANIWYGAASKDLIENTISGLERGNHEVVIDQLRTLRDRLEPTYENRADYDRLVGAYCRAISENPTLHERNAFDATGSPPAESMEPADSSTSR